MQMMQCTTLNLVRFQKKVTWTHTRTMTLQRQETPQQHRGMRAQVTGKQEKEPLKDAQMRLFSRRARSKGAGGKPRNKFVIEGIKSNYHEIAGIRFRLCPYPAV